MTSPQLITFELISEQQDQKPANKKAHHLNKATNALKIVQSSKWLNERRAFEDIYNKEKENSAATVASIIRKAKKKYPDTIGRVPDSTIRKWTKKL